MSELLSRSILIVEDERDIAQLLRLHLAELCDELLVATNGHEGLRAALSGRWGLVILDLGLPGVGGLEICRRLREKENYTPVLMLTAKATEQDRVHGLDSGADDYVTKPFCLLELLSRVKAIFRRCEALHHSARTEPEHARYKGLKVDFGAREVVVDGRPTALTAREFDLLAHFLQHPERVYTRSQLLDQVWGHGHQGYEHTVNSHINRLRSKIERDPSRPDYITTVWGVGYRLG